MEILGSPLSSVAPDAFGEILLGPMLRKLDYQDSSTETASSPTHIQGRLPTTSEEAKSENTSDESIPILAPWKNISNESGISESFRWDHGKGAPDLHEIFQSMARLLPSDVCRSLTKKSFDMILMYRDALAAAKEVSENNQSEDPDLSTPLSLLQTLQTLARVVSLYQCFAAPGVVTRNLQNTNTKVGSRRRSTMQGSNSGRSRSSLFPFSGGPNTGPGGQSPADLIPGMSGSLDQRFPVPPGRQLASLPSWARWKTFLNHPDSRLSFGIPLSGDFGNSKNVPPTPQALSLALQHQQTRAALAHSAFPLSPALTTPVFSSTISSQAAAAFLNYTATPAPTIACSCAQTRWVRMKSSTGSLAVQRSQTFSGSSAAAASTGTGSRLPASPGGAALHSDGMVIVGEGCVLHAHRAFLLSGGRERLLEIVDGQLDRLQRRLDFIDAEFSNQVDPPQEGESEEMKSSERDRASEMDKERRTRIREVLLEQPSRSLIIWCLRSLFRFSQLYDGQVLSCCSSASQDWKISIRVESGVGEQEIGDPQSASAPSSGSHSSSSTSGALDLSVMGLLSSRGKKSGNLGSTNWQGWTGEEALMACDCPMVNDRHDRLNPNCVYRLKNSPQEEEILTLSIEERHQIVGGTSRWILKTTFAQLQQFFEDLHAALPNSHILKSLPPIPHSAVLPGAGEARRIRFQELLDFVTDPSVFTDLMRSRTSSLVLAAFLRFPDTSLGGFVANHFRTRLHRYISLVAREDSLSNEMLALVFELLLISPTSDCSTTTAGSQSSPFLGSPEMGSAQLHSLVSSIPLQNPTPSAAEASTSGSRAVDSRAPERSEHLWQSSKTLDNRRSSGSVAAGDQDKQKGKTRFWFLGGVKKTSKESPAEERRDSSTLQVRGTGGSRLSNSFFRRSTVSGNSQAAADRLKAFHSDILPRLPFAGDISEIGMLRPVFAALHAVQIDMCATGLQQLLTVISTNPSRNTDAFWIARRNQTTLNNSCGWLHWILPLFFRALGVSNPTDPRLKIPSVSTELHQEGIEVPSEPVSAAQGVEIVVYQLSAQLSGMVLWQKLLRCTVPYPFRGNFHQTTLDAVALIGEAYRGPLRWSPVTLRIAQDLLDGLVTEIRLHSQIFTKDHSHPAWNNLFQLLSAFQDLLLFSIPNLTPTETGGTSSKSTGVGAAQVGSARGVQGDVDVVVRKRIGVEEDTKGEEGDVVVVLNERILSRVCDLLQSFKLHLLTEDRITEQSQKLSRNAGSAASSPSKSSAPPPRDLFGRAPGFFSSDRKVRAREWRACMQRNRDCGNFYLDYFQSARAAIRTTQKNPGVDVVLALKEFRLLFGQFQAIEAQRQHAAELETLQKEKSKLEQEQQRVLTQRKQLVKDVAGKGSLLTQVSRCLPVHKSRHSASAGVALLEDWRTEGVQRGQFYTFKLDAGKSIALARVLGGSREVQNIFQFRPSTHIVPGHSHPNFRHPSNRPHLRQFAAGRVTPAERRLEHCVSLHCCQEHYQDERKLLSRLGALQNASQDADHIQIPKPAPPSGEDSGSESGSVSESKGPDLEADIRALYDTATLSMMAPLHAPHSPNSVSLIFPDGDTLKRWQDFLAVILGAIKKTVEDPKIV